MGLGGVNRERSVHGHARGVIALRSRVGAGAVGIEWGGASLKGRGRCRAALFFSPEMDYGVS